jgi:hypothetical protein
MTLETAPEMLTVSDLQKITRLGRESVQQLFRNGILPNLGNTKRFLTSRAALKRFLEQGQK